MQCSYCGDVFEGRVDAKCCSDKCRQSLKRLSVTDYIVTDNFVTDKCDNVTDKVNVDVTDKLDIEKDLKMDMQKDLGITAWTEQGIFIREDITVEQVRNIRRCVEAKNGWERRGYL
jgi:hypothetical protein